MGLEDVIHLKQWDTGGEFTEAFWSPSKLSSNFGFDTLYYHSHLIFHKFTLHKNADKYQPNRDVMGISGNNIFKKYQHYAWVTY